MSESDGRRGIHEFEKNSLEVVRVSLTSYKGEPYIDIRCFYRGDDNELHPTPKGITIREDLFPELQLAIDKLHEALTPGSRR